MPQTILPTPTINPAIMRSLGFSLQFPLCDGQEPDDVYRGIQIFIDRPNGGALAVELAVIGASALSRRWAYPTFFEFSYTDDYETPKGIILDGFTGGSPKPLSLKQGTAMEFEELDKDEHVFAVEEDAKLYGNQPHKIHKTGELLRFALQQCGSVIGSGGWLTNAGVRGQLLKIGSSGWVPGKMRFRLVMEFCPDEPEPKPSTLPASELDEFRQ